MNNLIIRRMEEGDLSQVCAIEEATFSMPWSRKSFQDTLSYYHTLFLVAELGGEIAGYCGCYQSLEEAEITNVAAYTLEVRVSNQAAIHLYESLGFASFGIRKNFYEKPKEDAMIMWRHWEA